GSDVAMASSPCEMTHPASGWAEQDPRDWERALAAAVRAVRAKAGIVGSEVGMIGLASQVDGLVAMDDQLRALRPAIIWLDRRATSGLVRRSFGACRARPRAAPRDSRRGRGGWAAAPGGGRGARSADELPGDSRDRR